MTYKTADGETAESSHPWTDDVESETLEESEVLSDVKDILTATTVSFWENVPTRPKCSCLTGSGFAR